MAMLLCQWEEQYSALVVLQGIIPSTCYLFTLRSTPSISQAFPTTANFRLSYLAISTTTVDMTDQPMMRRDALPALFDSAGMSFPLTQNQDTQDVPTIPRRSSKRLQFDRLRSNAAKPPSPITDLFVDPDSVICKRLYRERMADTQSGEEEDLNYEYDESTAHLTLVDRRMLNRNIGLDCRNPFLKPPTWPCHRNSVEKMSPRYVQPLSYFSDDDTESTYSKDDDDELLSPIENPFSDNRFPLLSISSLEKLVNNQIFANDVLDTFADMDVGPLITDIKNTKHILVDHDHLRGKPEVFDLKPHEWSSSCFCAHCEQFSNGLDYSESHSVEYCPCPICFMVRQKAKWAEEDRLHKETQARRRQVLAKRTQKPWIHEPIGKETDEDVFVVTMPDEDEDDENVVDAGAKTYSVVSSMVMSALRSPDE